MMLEKARHERRSADDANNECTCAHVRQWGAPTVRSLDTVFAALPAHACARARPQACTHRRASGLQVQASPRARAPPPPLAAVSRCPCLPPPASACCRLRIRCTSSHCRAACCCCPRSVAPPRSPPPSLTPSPMPSRPHALFPVRVALMLLPPTPVPCTRSSRNRVSGVTGADREAAGDSMRGRNVTPADGLPPRSAVAAPAATAATAASTKASSPAPAAAAGAGMMPGGECAGRAACGDL